MSRDDAPEVNTCPGGGAKPYDKIIYTHSYMHVMPNALQAKCAIDKAILTNYYRPRNWSGWSGSKSIMMPFVDTYKRAPSVSGSV